MTIEEIKEYKSAIGKQIRLFGYTSTSLNENLALKFAWENQESKHYKVLIHIRWNYSRCYYYLNGGAYDHEEEILLMDGVKLTVISVEKIKDSKGQFAHYKITLSG